MTSSNRALTRVNPTSIFSPSLRSGELGVLPLLDDGCGYLIEPLVDSVGQLRYRPRQRIERRRDLVHFAFDRMNTLREIVNAFGHRRAFRRVYHRRFARVQEHDACRRDSSHCPKDLVDWLAKVAQTATVVCAECRSYCARQAISAMQRAARGWPRTGRPGSRAGPTPVVRVFGPSTNWGCSRTFADRTRSRHSTAR